MNVSFIFITMVFCHIIDDYVLQGWLASAKQKEYWEKNAPQELYKYDYIWALFMHSFSWTFMIMLPIAYIQSFNIDALFCTVFYANVSIHVIVDDLKANKKKINLWQDQLIHMLQILITMIILL